VLGDRSVIGTSDGSAADTTPVPEGLELEQGRIAFGTAVGLEDMHLHVRRGERVTLLGPSGAGKTSLLRAIAGLGPLVGGRVRIDGRDVTALPPERRGIVYMHQAPSLVPHLSVLDNVAFPLEVRGVAREAARTQARGLLERVQLATFAHRAPASLSGGQRHRTALARALAANPVALLLDEPFSSLDPALRAEVRDAVLGLLQDRSGPAVLLVTHDIEEASAISDRIIVLLEARIAQCGPPAEVLGAPRTVAVARFLGLGNLLPGFRNGHGAVNSLLGTFAAPGPARAVTVVCRPSALRVRPRLADDARPAATVVAAREQLTGRLLKVRIGSSPHSRDLLAVPGGEGAGAIGAAVSLDVDVAALHVIDEDESARTGDLDAISRTED
jgi:ABC-type Fe3+/spermidine/putrescine transport system ATPase subunit